MFLRCFASWWGEAAPSAMSAADHAARTPEALGLRTLPQYSSLEEARRALVGSRETRFQRRQQFEQEDDALAP